MNIPELYYKKLRHALTRRIQAGGNRILDVGCAEGMLGESLKKQGLAGEVIGIELVSDVAKVASARIDRVICGDIETIDRDGLGLEAKSFDYIICGDVLEHLRDPWETLTWLVSLLKKDGKLIASIPNVRHWSVVMPLLFRGKWEYKAHGVMDQTHLRFFTRESAVAMFHKCGLKVESCEGSTLRGKKDKMINVGLLGLGKEFVSAQWILVGIPDKQ